MRATYITKAFQESLAHRDEEKGCQLLAHSPDDAWILLFGLNRSCQVRASCGCSPSYPAFDIFPDEQALFHGGTRCNYNYNFLRKYVVWCTHQPLARESKRSLVPIPGHASRLELLNTDLTISKITSFQKLVPYMGLVSAQ